MKSKVPEKELFVVTNYLVILNETVNSSRIVKCIEYNFWVSYIHHMDILDLQNKTVYYKIIDNIMFKVDGETGITFTSIFKITPAGILLRS